MTEETDTTQLRQELAEQREKPEARPLRDLIARNRDEFVKLLGSEQIAEQFVTAAMTEWRFNPGILECDPYSVVGGMRQAAQLGLSFGPLGHVYLVPYKQKGGPSWATFIIGYKGMVALAYGSGLVKRIEANVVRDGDGFAHRFGSRAFLDFTSTGPPNNREWKAVYALAELKTGGKVFSVLWPEDVERRRKRSKAAESKFSPWQTDPEQMWEKSAVRDLQRFLPQTPALALALEQDEKPAESLNELSDSEDGNDGGKA
jgi:recombination protein RecT